MPNKNHLKFTIYSVVVLEKNTDKYIMTSLVTPDEQLAKTIKKNWDDDKLHPARKAMIISNSLAVTVRLS